MITLTSVDLTTGEVSRESVAPHWENLFVGGWGIAAMLAYDLIRPGIDPFSSENPVIIGTGTLVGTPVPSANQVFAITKSTVHAGEDRRYLISCGSGGSLRFGKNLQQTGSDLLVLTGKASSPSYLLVDDDEVRLLDAADLWGAKNLYETADILLQRHPGSGIISIGRAGETGVRYAFTFLDKVGTLGRAGLGAVLGSKLIKGIVVRGTRTVPIASPERLREAVRIMKKEGIDPKAVKAVHELGGHASWNKWLKAFNAGIWPTSTWDRHYGVAKFKEAKGKTSSCDKCHLGCKTSLLVRDGPLAGTEIPAGYYICVAALAQRLELEDHREAIKLLEVCDAAGMCFFSALNTVDCTTRLFTAGKITESDTDGLTLRRDFATYLKLFQMIRDREGVGATLADGWYELSRRFGFDAIHEHPWVGIAKGFDTIVDARFWGLDSTTFAYFVNPRGHHGIVHSLQYGGNPRFDLATLRKDLLNTGASTEAADRIFQPVPYYGKFNAARMTRHIEDRGAIIQALGVCDNLSAGAFFPMESLSECYSAVTGIETSPEELKAGGERIHNLFKMLNVREGFSRSDDTVPAWFIPINTPEGMAVMRDYYGEHVLSGDDVVKLLDDYYDERGWNQAEGVPTKSKLAELGLDKYAIEGIPE